MERWRTVTLSNLNYLWNKGRSAIRRNKISLLVKLTAPRIPPHNNASLPTSFNKPPFWPKSVNNATSLFHACRKENSLVKVKQEKINPHNRYRCYYMSRPFLIHSTIFFHRYHRTSNWHGFLSKACDHVILVIFRYCLLKLVRLPLMITFDIRGLW